MPIIERSFVFKLFQGISSGITLLILYGNILKSEFAFISSFSAILTSLGIIDFGLGVIFVNLNLKTRRENYLTNEKKITEIFEFKPFIIRAILLSVFLAVLVIPTIFYLNFRFRLEIDQGTFLLYAIFSFVFFLGNFMSKIYLVINMVDRLFKLQFVSSLLQLMFTIGLIFLSAPLIFFVFLLSLPSAIFMLDLLIINFKNAIKYTTKISWKSSIKFSYTLQLVQLGQTATSSLVTILIAKYLSDNEVALTALVQRIMFTLLAAVGTNFIKSWVNETPVVFLSSSLIKIFQRTKWRIAHVGFSILILLGIMLSSLKLNLINIQLIPSKTFITIILWVVVFISQITLWTVYYDFLRSERYLSMSISTIFGLVILLPVTLIFSNVGLFFPPLLLMFSQITMELTFRSLKKSKIL